MKANFHQCTLADISEIVMGQSPPGDRTNVTGGGTPLLNGPTEFGSSHPNPVQYTTDPRKFSQPEDILFCVRGSTVGRMNWSDRQYAIGRGLAAIRHKGGIEYQHYLRALIKHKLDELLSSSTGSTFPNISKDQLSNIKIEVPPLPEQRAIARILGSLDDKIELNRHMNATLEAMAQAIFKSWFVDFDPVRAKMEGREPAGMNAETAALFPDAFEGVDGQEVPEGWNVSTIGSVLKLAYGKALKESDRHPGQIPVYGSNGQVGWHDEPLVKGPGIIIGRKGNPGTVAWSQTDFFPIDTTFYVVPKVRSMNLLYLYYELMFQNLPSQGSDSAVPGLNRNIAYMNSITIPSNEIIKRFDATIMPLFKLVHLNTMQSRTLVALRDTLLPKLISGEIRVPDAMLEVAEA